MRQKTRRLIVSCMVAIAVVIGISAVLLAYQDRLGRIIRADSYLSLEEVSKQDVSLIYERVDSDRRIISSIADFFSRFPEPCTSRILQDFLVTETGYTHFSNIVFADSSGTIWNSDGPTNRNISGQPYFQEAISGNTVVSSVVLSVDTWSPVLVIASPVYRNGEIVGIIAGRYLMEMLDDLLTAESFEGKGVSYLTASDGLVLLSSKNAPMNLSDFKTDLHGAGSADDIARMRTDMEAGVSDILTYRLDGQEFLLMYSPIGINGWYLMTVLPQDVMNARSWAVFQQVLGVFGLLTILFIALVAFILWIHSRDRKQLIQVNHDMTRFSDILPGGICRFRKDKDWTIIFANEGFYQLVGYTQEELESRFQSRLSAILYPPDVIRFTEIIQSLVGSERSQTEDIRLICADGSLKWIWFNAELGGDESIGDCVHSTFVNISSLKQVQEQLQMTKRRYDLVLNQTEDIIFDWNVKDRTIYHSHTFRMKLGYDPVSEDFPEKAVQENLIDEHDIDSFLDIFSRIEQGKQISEGQIRIKNVEGESIWFRVIATTVFDSTGAPVRAVGTLQDINAQKQAWQEVTDSAGRDSLTQLYNRRMTAQRVESILADRYGTIAFAVIDIDNFKQVNDSMGHLYGDVVLSEMARVLKENCATSDIVGRIGGDEFCVFFPHVDDEEALRGQTSRIIEVLHKFGKNSVSGYEISASMGVVMVRPDDDPLLARFDSLFQKADIALYYAKRKGKNQCAFYSEQIANEVMLGRSPCLVTTRIDEMPMRQKNFKENINDYFFKIFFDYSNVEKAVPVLLDLVGKLFGTSRVFICEYSPDETSLTTTFEWCNVGIPSVKDRYQNIATMDSDDLKDCFDENNLFFCPDVSALSGNSKFVEILRSRDCMSILLCLITEGGSRKALMGFEQCDMVRYPSRDEMDTLSHLAKIVCLFLLRDREQQRVSSLLLDRIGSYAYVIDLADFRLTYINKHVVKKCPDATLGAFCYQAIRGNDAVCPDCPLRKGLRQHDNAILTFPEDTLVSASFSIFKRQEKNLCLVCCNGISRYDTQMFLPSKGLSVERGLLVDVLDDIVYVSDPKTYELLYVNKAGRVHLGLIDTDYIGHRCYEALQHRSAPCPFCTNDKLTYDDFYIWEHTNPIVNRHYILKDKLIDWNGKPARLEFAIDVTVKENVSKALGDRLDKSKAIIECIGSLITAENLDVAVRLVLEKLGRFYQANRTYIFEIDYPSQTVSNTYEWLAEGVSPQKQGLQRIPLTSVRRWMDYFHRHESVVIDDMKMIESIDIEEYRILASQDIKSLYATPFFIQDKLVGFIGMDDTVSHHDDLSMLDSLSYFIIEEIIKRRMQDELRVMGYHDSLTGLPNRSSYVKRLAELEQEAPKSVGVLVADINGLKQTNMDYGHAYGDKQVMEVGSILARRFSGYDVFRLDGDEFIIICVSVSQSDFVGLIQKLRNDMAGQSVSFGHTWSDLTPDIETLIVHADELMNIEKQQYYKHVTTLGKHYDPIRYENLKEGLEHGDFLMYLQPKEEVANGRLCGAEALCRYWTEEKGLITPNRFIPTLEKERLIKYVDLYIFEEVCKLLDRWIKEGRTVFPISLNFSRITLLEYGLIDEILAIHGKYAVPRNLIEIEITESIGEMEREVVAGIGARIHEQGFLISLDDFGSKYTSMSILSMVPFHTLKIDRSLVDDIEGNQRTRTLVKHVIEICNDLGVQCIAEGVETAGQLKVLRDLRCEFVQGYYFDKPLPLERFEQKYMISTPPPPPRSLWGFGRRLINYKKRN